MVPSVCCNPARRPSLEAKQILCWTFGTLKLQAKSDFFFLTFFINVHYDICTQCNLTNFTPIVLLTFWSLFTFFFNKWCEKEGIWLLSFLLVVVGINPCLLSRCFRIILTSFIFLFSDRCIKYFSHIHRSSLYPLLSPSLTLWYLPLHPNTCFRFLSFIFKD
jgi:hypothetical protein